MTLDNVPLLNLKYPTPPFVVPVGSVVAVVSESKLKVPPSCFAAATP